MVKIRIKILLVQIDRPQNAIKPDYYKQICSTTSWEHIMEKYSEVPHPSEPKVDKRINQRI